MAATRLNVLEACSGSPPGRAIHRYGQHAGREYGPLGKELENLTVSGVKDERILGANSNKISNGEKTAVIDALVRILPVREPEMLFVQEMFKCVQAGRIALPAIKIGDVFIDNEAISDFQTRAVAAVREQRPARTRFSASGVDRPDSDSDDRAAIMPEYS